MEEVKHLGTLYAALAKAQGAITHAKKDKSNPFFKSTYADLASVMDACKKPLSDNGLAVFQTLEEGDGGLYLNTVLAHSSGYDVRSRMKVSPVKSDPQGVGSAITYARRYALAAIVGVAAEDEDDDGNAGSGKNAPKPSMPPCPKCGKADKVVEATKNPAAGAFGCVRCTFQFDPQE